MPLPHYYNHHYVAKTKGDPSLNLIETRIYRFRSLKTRKIFIVNIECYQKNIYAIKFFPKNHSLSKYRYNILTNDNEPRRIIMTCIRILSEIYESDPKSSFCFIGTNSRGESKENTKRHRVYKVIVNTYFGEQTFSHHYDDQKSAYALVRKTELQANPGLINEIEEFFCNIYDL